MSPCVLVVDDSTLVLEGLRFALTHAGMEVVEASTCRDARQSAEQSALDAVLLDIRMPDGDGLELLAHFKTRQPNLPVLIHSYYNRRSCVSAR
jgi:DNA-binding NtrC family response regulator